MDKSYVSRLLSKFEKQKLITREPVPGSKGLKKIQLTQAGNQEVKRIDQSGSRQIAEKLKSMDAQTRDKLCQAMEFIEKALRENNRKEEPYG